MLHNEEFIGPAERPVMVDKNNDGMSDMFIGNNSGGLALFLGDSILINNTWNCIGNSCISTGDGSGSFCS